MNIDVDLDALRQKKEEVSALASDFYNELTKVNSIVNNMAGSWENANFTNFKNKMDGFISDMNSVVGSLKSYNNFIDTYVGTHSALDALYSKNNIKIK